MQQVKWAAASQDPFLGWNCFVTMGSGIWAQWLSASRKELEFQEEARVKGYFLEKLDARNVN
jgi:hypothetical protein